MSNAVPSYMMKCQALLLSIQAQDLPPLHVSSLSTSFFANAGCGRSRKGGRGERRTEQTLTNLLPDMTASVALIDQGCY